VKRTIDTRPRARPTIARRVVDDDELTPFQRFGCWYKRDDLFQPYADVPLSGGKVRQARALPRRNRERIRDEFDGVVLTATGVHSPQGLIIARVALDFGFRCVLFVGATDASALARHAMLRTAVERFGAELDTSARVAYEPALAVAQERWRERHDGRGYVVRFGINLEDDPDAILGSTAAQVANVPDSVERIVVPVGAGVTAAGVLLGARERASHATIVAVQVAGYDRREELDRMSDGAPYEWHAIEGVPYARHVRADVAPDFGLDPIYEAKAWRWLREHERADESVAFWVVGDSRQVRAGT
jgi:1-aminocyclopropane-1-carboxylate deaminase/D-cysteine desulfhydrase-like pyridoxal-dependent ACC family enzyme